ncbi:MAG TPA: prepilin-type N-terminal cleavage/methylation domain-containing protein [Thermoanaerobaculia bacterium]|nr:prepilin-type N-terminal cleavage/methylation domain-containing protein [Thermoanaerobaculia bacterium]
MRGFSLVEVLISMAILSAILTAVLGMFTLGLHRAYGGKKMTEATVLAEHALERLNQPAAQELLAAASSDSSATKAWQRKTDADGTSIVTAAEVSGSNFAFRNELRDLFMELDLPFGRGESKRSEMVATMTAVPSGSTFANAEMLRIQVVVRWAERGQRSRQVVVETLNLRSE